MYALYLFSQQGKELPLSKREFDQIVSIIKYYSKQGNISWFAIYSTKKSDTAEKIVTKTGKRGRPKKYVSGENVPGHAHIALLGDKDHSAHSTARKIKLSLDKKFSRKICRVHTIGNYQDAIDFTRYCFKQADIERTGGPFDFRSYAKV